MSRYIDADALKKSYGMADECSDCVTNSRDCQFNFTFTKMDFCGWIDDAPTADVVEVVRCKDCFYAKPYNAVWYLPLKENNLWCSRYEEEKEKDWFCADAIERTVKDEQIH